MGLDEAAECAGLVEAKHNIPYHVTAKRKRNEKIWFWVNAAACGKWKLQ